MTPTDRIERAARAIDPAAWKPGFEHSFARRRADAVRIAKDAFTAAYPDLMADPPSHWIAPVDPTPEMREAGAKAVEASIRGPSATASYAFEAMRNAHLKEQG